MHAQTLLIVDDEDDVIQALRFRLETSGYKVVTASNGLEALEHLEKIKIDLVLADFMMPEINGLELAERIRSNAAWADTKLVLFSCHTEAELRARARALGALDYLPKTAGAGAIVRRVYAILSAKHEPKPVSRGDELLISEQLRFFSEKTSSPSHRGPGADAVPEGMTGYPDDEDGPDIDLRRLASSIAAFGSRDSKSYRQAP